MNTDAVHKVVRLDENELQELTLEVKETLANGSLYPEKAKENFTTLNMWNVLRQSRSASAMIRKWSN
ncbi:MAG: hypothetical protein JWM28_3794 [Chitinophagaceae bacterium]|nr:hypothetical protein [Chitinophagaceae bacterium]